MEDEVVCEHPKGYSFEMNRLITPFEAEVMLQIKLKDKMYRCTSDHQKKKHGDAIKKSKFRANQLDKALNTDAINLDDYDTAIKAWRMELIDKPVIRSYLNNFENERVTETPYTISSLYEKALSIRQDGIDGQVHSSDTA